MTLVLTVTGHRLGPRLGGYGMPIRHKLYNLADATIPTLAPSLVLSGMATGWDQACAWVCIDRGIPFHAYIPFEGQETRWPRELQDAYRVLMGHAAAVHVASAQASGWAFHKRNDGMVRACTAGLALYDGGGGGTADCVDRFKRYGSARPLLNVWELWN